MFRFSSISITLILAFGSAAAQPARNSSIAGRAVNDSTGAPLRRATVEIILDGRRDIRGMAPTDGDGQFILRALPPGRYHISVFKSGYARMEYGARRPGGTGQVITLGVNENKSGLIIRLPQLGSISGTVIGAGSGAGPGTTVTAYRLDFPRGKAGWVPAGGISADNRGHFRLYHLYPGRYLVAANQPSAQGFRGQPPGAPEEPVLQPMPTLTYHPSAVIQQDGVPIDLGPGMEVQDVDIAIQEALPIHLKVQVQLPPEIPIPAPADGPQQPPRFSGPIWIRSVEEGPDNWARSLSPTPDQWYESRIPRPGRYILSGMVEVDSKRYAARQEVSLTGGSAEISLPFARAIDMPGHVRIVGPNAPDTSKMHVTLVAGELSFMEVERVNVRPDGSFLLKSVPPGLWDIAVEPIPRGGYLKSMMLGKLDVLTKDMYVSADTRGSLEIVVSTRAAEFRGHVDEGVATTILAAHQGELASVLSFYAVTGVDEEGNFVFRSLTPGSYKIYAFEEMAPQAWLDPNFLKNYPESGTPVELQEGPAPAIKLKAIPGSTAKKKDE